MKLLYIKWEIVDLSDKEQFFITSDNPSAIMWENNRKYELIPSSHCISKMITFPITKNIAIIGHNSNSFRLDRFNIEKICSALNTIQIQRAKAQVYSPYKEISIWHNPNELIQSLSKYYKHL